MITKKLIKLHLDPVSLNKNQTNAAINIRTNYLWQDYIWFD